ncbi:transcriptional adapter 2-beta-like [Liolophura sinensis]|uniref:transcriptional adapter 2-beta-like n=1 Tax=Liolophura sinensis TaxID=3198878 RepID=UPI003158595D
MAKDHCGYCQCDISTVKVRCTECPDFDLCLQCFSCGAEIGTHKKEHSYQIAGEGTTAVFDTSERWSALEETCLLDAVEQYGFGNWEDVANHVETKKPSECLDHYTNFYIHGNIGRATFSTEQADSIKDHTCTDSGPLSPSLTSPIPPIELSLQEQQELGYMPFRDDFEREHENDAEVFVSGLSINYDEDDIDIAVKLSHVDKYRLKLHEREKRKKIARSYGLIAAATSSGIKQKSQQPKKKISKDEREFQEKMKVFAQFHSSTDHEQFFEHLQKEKELKSRIKELVRHRKNGITKTDDIEEFEDEKFKREKKKENKKKMGSSAPTKRTSMVSKKAGEKLDFQIEEEELKDDNEEEEEAKELSAMPGYVMLSDRERKLCSSIGMTPANYITIKTCIIKDYLQRKQGYPVKIRYPSGLDKTHRRKIMSFLTDNGWIGVT